MEGGGGCFDNSIYSLGMFQVIITFAVVMYFPLASVQVFVYSPCVHNGTLTHACGNTHATRLALPLPCMTMSVAAAAFVSSTYTLAEQGAIEEGSAYGAESLGQTGLWNALFWFIVTGVHAIVITAACSPVDTFAAVGATYLMVNFLAKLCAHSDECRAGNDSTLNNMGVTMANVSILGYMAGACLAFYCIPSQYSNRLVILFLLVVLDYFLGIGHLWDRTPDMKTIGNCRLFWVCSATLCLSALYGAWTDSLLIPSMPAGGDSDAN